MQILPDSLLSKVEDTLDSFRVPVSDDKGFARALDQSIQEARHAIRPDLAGEAPRDAREPGARDSRNLRDDATSEDLVERALLAGAPYNPTPEILSPFAPGPVRLTQKETDALVDAMRADGVSARALNAMRDAGRYPGGATADQILLAARNALEGEAPVLSRGEEALLQSLALKTAGSRNLFSDGTARNALASLMEGLAASPTNVIISRDEMAALAKALRLPEGTARALLDGFHGEDSLSLSGREWNRALSQARAQLDQNAADMDSLLTSLQKHLTPLLRDASRREEMERLAGMREDKSVSQARELIRDRATAAAPGREDRVDPDSQTRATPRRARDAEELPRHEGDHDRQTRESARTPEQSGARFGERADELQANELQARRAARHNARTGELPDDELPGGDEPGQTGAAASQNARAENARGGENAAVQTSAHTSAQTSAHAGANASAQTSAQTGAQTGAERAADRVRPDADAPADSEDREENAGSRESGADRRGAPAGSSGTAGTAGTAGASEAFRAAAGASGVLYATAAQGADTVIPPAEAGDLRAPRLPAQTLEQISDAILSADRNGVQRLELALTPGDLGGMTVVLTTRHGEVSALIQPERAETAALIAEQVERIRAQLENQGFKVDKVDVQTQLSDQQNPAWQGAEQHNASRDLAAQVEHLERLRRLSRSSSSASSFTGADLSGDNSTLARDMHLQARQAILAGHGLHIVA